MIKLYVVDVKRSYEKFYMLMYMDESEVEFLYVLQKHSSLCQ